MELESVSRMFNELSEKISSITRRVLEEIRNICFGKFKVALCWVVASLLLICDPVAEANRNHKFQDLLDGWSCLSVMTPEKRMSIATGKYGASDSRSADGTVTQWDQRMRNPRSKKMRRYRRSKTNYPYTSWIGTKVVDDGKSYHLFNFGLQNLVADALDLRREFVEKRLRYPDDSIEFRSVGMRKKTLQILHKFRWTIHDSVLDIYRRWKSDYLSESALEELKLPNKGSDNHDVFAIFDTPSKPFEELTEAEIKEYLLVTIEVFYSFGGQILRPSILWDLHQTSPSRVFGSMPFEFRLNGEAGRKFKNAFDRKFRNRKLAEFIRYGKISNLPRSAHVTMLLQAFETAQRRGVDTIVISVDSKTREMFEGPFRFSLFAELPTGQSVEPEFLLHLDVHSEDFQKTLADLRAQVQQVNSQSEMFTEVSP